MTNIGKHILVVEDDEFVQELLAICLRDKGYKVSVAATGKETRLFFGKERPDLVLLDLTLPDADGLDLAGEIRAFSSVPIMVLTARKGRYDRLTALGVGADDYLTKPCDPEEILLRVRNILNRAGKQVPAAPPKGLGGTGAAAGVWPPGGTAAALAIAALAVAVIGIIIGAKMFFAETPPPSPAAGAGSPSVGSGDTKAQSATALLGIEWVHNNTCGQIPRVEWWGEVSHMKVLNYVNTRHGGDWRPYIEKWALQQVKMQDIHDRGSAAITKEGIRLGGAELKAYIEKISKRLSVVRCLAMEASKAKSKARQH